MSLIEYCITLFEVMYDKDLIFTSHAVILRLLLRDRVSAAHNLTSEDELSRLYIPPGRNELPLRLSKKLDNILVFRKR